MSEFACYRYQSKFSKSFQLKRFAWEITWIVLYRTTPRWAFNGWRVALLRLFGAKIGEGSKVSPSCFVWAPWNLTMGDYSVLGDQVDCYTMDKIVIGSKVAVSQRSFLCTGTHDITSLMRPLKTKPILIENHVWICAEAFVGPGVQIGEGAVVAARAVIVKTVSPWMVVGGNPARELHKRNIDA